MANRLNVAKVHSIQTLHERGWSQRRIARELGIDRETVARHLRLHGGGEGSNPATGANAPPGSAAPSPADPAGPSTPPTGCVAWEGDLERTGGCDAPAGVEVDRDGDAPEGAVTGPRSGPTSGCEPYRSVILAKLQQGLSAVRIHQDLVQDHGSAAPSYHSVRRYVAKLQHRSPDPFRRIESPPGHEAQVDFGTGAPIRDASGRRRATHVLRVVLSHSRAGYSETVPRQTTEQFIRCLENAFHHFGGVPETVVLDNLRAAVSRADWFEPHLNPKVRSFFEHYGTVALPTRPRMPHHKGKVERGVAYVQANGLKGHTFTDMLDQNAHLRWWEANVADTRIHGTTKRQVREVFEQVERPALRPLPPTRFPCFEEGRRTVHRDGHVAVAKAYYSVPPEYLGREVWVRYDSRLVRIHDIQMDLIATHIRQAPGRFSTQDKHILDRKIAGVERGTMWLLRKVGQLGPQARRWGEPVLEARGIEGVRVLQGLIALGDRQPAAQIERACELAMDHRCFHLRTVRQLVKRQLEHAQREQTLPGMESWVDEHPIIRSLADYGRFVHEAIVHPCSMETPNE